jgi:hypothetical protein
MSKKWIHIAVLSVSLATLFSAGFVFFYSRMQRPSSEVVDSSKSFINKPLPTARLIDTSGAKVDEQILRKGRVVLVFVTPECNACLVEGKFLETLLERREDVTFYGLIPFGARLESQEAAQAMFPFKVFYDDGDTLVKAIGINRVPVKVFLEDGIIKKGWIGAALTDQAKASFSTWLNNLQ